MLRKQQPRRGEYKPKARIDAFVKTHPKGTQRRVKRFANANASQRGFLRWCGKNLFSHRCRRLFIVGRRGLNRSRGVLHFPRSVFLRRGQSRYFRKCCRIFMIVHKKFGFACGRQGFVRESGTNPSSSFFVHKPSFWRIKAEKLIFPRISSTLARSSWLKITVNCDRRPLVVPFGRPPPLRAPPQVPFFFSVSILFFLSFCRFK